MIPGRLPTVPVVPLKLGHDFGNLSRRQRRFLPSWAIGTRSHTYEVSVLRKLGRFLGWIQFIGMARWVSDSSVDVGAGACVVEGRGFLKGYEVFSWNCSISCSDVSRID